MQLTFSITSIIGSTLMIVLKKLKAKNPDFNSGRFRKTFAFKAIISYPEFLKEKETLPKNSFLY
jgi:hypothetical protein